MKAIERERTRDRRPEEKRQTKREGKAKETKADLLLKHAGRTGEERQKIDNQNKNV